MSKTFAALTILMIGLVAVANAIPQSYKSKATYSDAIDDDEIPKDAKRGYAHFPKFLADVNGDGIRDFCRAVGNVPPVLACQLGKEGGGFKFKEFIGPNKMNWGSDKRPQWMEDVNEDERADFCRYVGIRYVATLADDDGFSAELVRIKKTSQGWRVIE